MEKLTEEELIEHFRNEVLEKERLFIYGPHPRIVKRKMNDGLSNKTIEVSSEALQRSINELQTHQPLQQVTGAVHGAAWCNLEGQILVLREDVGRHNAFDKAIGRLMLARLTSEEKIFLTSGRISSEMALKAAHSRIPVVATITTGTDLAVRIAENAGLTLVARVLTASPMVLCGQKRIVNDEESC